MKDEISFDELNPSRSWNFVHGGEPIGFHRGPRGGRRGWILMAWSLFAAVVDLLIAFSLTCFFAVLFMGVAGVSPKVVSVFFRAVSPEALGLCFVLVFSSYLLFLRVFAGCTVGEWACGIRLGEPRHRMARDYTFKVVQRFLIVSLSGGVVLPLVSLVMGKDLAGRLSGLPLVQHHNR